MRETRNKGFEHVRCIISNEKKVLEKDNDIKERRREYFNKYLN